MKSDIPRSGLRFVIVPKVVHPWFDEVHKGALSEAALLQRQLGIRVEIEYLPPRTANIGDQNSILRKVAASGRDGLAVDPLDDLFNLGAVAEIQALGVPVVVFDSPSPDAKVLSIGNDFRQQGAVAAERLVSLIGGRGMVAVMQGFPSAPNHRQRYEAQIEVLRKHPGVTIVDGGIDNDDIPTASREAARVLQSNPDLGGYLCCDASGPVGIATAIREAGKAGKVAVVGMDGIRPTLEAIREGVIESSVSTIPRMQGSMAILMLWQAASGVQVPRRIDTGIDVITGENVDSFLSAC